ncbi:GGDEF domain-containing protein [Arthrobacter sp. GN70]|uniref:GGDEF domain-containing protein n=2 Tax=Arthrobacter TaxID=1663 RepID=A0A4R5K9W7_9MICC|nr:GGDEF domain-containing protein [Arthrobacter sp. GN70]TDF91796.1 GGDEF domain-containing protein [Arthrobacter terricola]
MPVAGWCVEARQDPITGLVAFPDFYDELPDILEDCRARGVHLGIAIGDVDDLKAYVEHSKSSDPAAFGHVAGCALMQSLGDSSTRWYHALNLELGCLATFGGDEIIVALPVERNREGEFVQRISDLRDLLKSELPRTVSFGFGVLWHEDLARLESSASLSEMAVGLLSRIDQSLFGAKAEARGRGERYGGLLSEAKVHV